MPCLPSVCCEPGEATGEACVEEAAMVKWLCQDCCHGRGGFAGPSTRLGQLGEIRDCV